jgi:hypothetical protein
MSVPEAAAIIAAAATVFISSAACLAEPAPAAPSGADVQRAIDSARRFLIEQIRKDGNSAGETDANNCRYGGKTALLAQALLWARTDPAKCPPLARCLDWLAGAKLTGTYAVALRACAWGLLGDPNSLPLLRQDAQWLVRAANDQGAYTYTSSNGQAAQVWDNSNSQMALLGVSAAIRRGLEAPPAYLRLVRQHWLDNQQPDGGWGYLTTARMLQAPAGGSRSRSYGSMTAAGLASLYVCFDSLHGEDFVRCAADGESPASVKAIEWLARNFNARENPAKGVEWYHYWLYCVARVGLASGHKYLGQHDWFAEGAAALLEGRNSDGSFGYGDRVAETAFALMFLIRGQSPVLVNKLRYPGQWNPRPRDAANLAQWMTMQFERNMNWQIVTLDSPIEHWHEAPVLYISGAGPVDIDTRCAEKLRQYVRQGGTLLSEAACNSGDFTIDMGRLYARIFPDRPLIRLPAAHQVYSSYFHPKAETPLFAVTNGVRLLAVHAPNELSLGLQLGPRDTNLPTYQLAANIWALATDRSIIHPRDAQWWPRADKTEPVATIRLARLRHNGNFDPEPLAWQRFAIRLNNRFHVRLDVSAPMTIAELDANAWPIAHMTGTDPFELTDRDQAALRKFFEGGGTLVADAAGGNELFLRSFEKQVLPLAAGDKTGRLAQDNPIYAAGPYNLTKVLYRTEYAQTLGESEKTRPQLRAVLKNDRPVILLSEQDITTGLLGIPIYRLKGYSPDSAEQLMTNVLFQTAGVKAEGK